MSAAGAAPLGVWGKRSTREEATELFNLFEAEI